MPRIQHTVQIARPPAEVFAVTNDIDNWRVLFNEYNHSEVLRREDAGRFTKLVFRLTNSEGASWQSWRLLDHVDLVAVAQRERPLFPFRYMHLTWTYQPVDGGTLMTWTQDFELDPALATPLAEVTARMDAHGRDNQVRIKQLIESGAVATPAA
ncbi:MAG: aromatase [Micromonosporaceae bacterium]|jgi:aromatase|nr:aromatase [Micromonosporaceae bacterium]MDT5035894.1 aromatase [Micromonosporaceae bacterium]